MEGDDTMDQLDTFVRLTRIVSARSGTPQLRQHSGRGPRLTLPPPGVSSPDQRPAGMAGRIHARDPVRRHGVRDPGELEKRQP